MSGIKPVITDILTKLKTIQVVNADNQTVNLYAQIWNNQVNHIREGKDYVWSRPAAFVEIISPVNFDIIGLGLRSADIGIRIHLVDDFYNSDGTFEQNLNIFDFRDKIVLAHNTDTSKQSGLSQFMPTDCSPMNCVNESQEYEHDNLYHYICEFVCNFIDDKGSKYTGDQFNDDANPDLDAEIENGGTIPPSNPETDYFIISQ